MKRCAIIAAQGWICRRTERKEVEQLRKDLAKLGTDFDSNIVNAKAPVVFHKGGARWIARQFLCLARRQNRRRRLHRDGERHLAIHRRRRERQEAKRRARSFTSFMTRSPKTRTSPFSIKCSCCATRSRSGSATNRGTISKPKSKWRRPAPARNPTSTISSPASSRNSPPRFRRSRK